jgi:hypothetical protein
MFFLWIRPEIYRDYPQPPLFSVAQGIVWLSTESLSRVTLDLKEGSLYCCILLSCNCDVLHRRLCADSDKISEGEGRTSTCILPLFGFDLCYWIVVNQWKASSDLTVASPPLGVKGDPVRVETLIVPPSHHLCQNKIVNRKSAVFLNFQTYGKVLKSKSHSDICTLYNPAKNTIKKNHLSKPAV